MGEKGKQPKPKRKRRYRSKELFVIEEFYKKSINIHESVLYY